ncbi:MAG: response regulator, partial [Blautia sp.]|nr:response regulator [Blautia sp.]
MSSAQETMKDAGKKKVLIVEDDFVVRRGIQYSLEWDKYDLAICGDATNGQQGLIQMENLHPDIIITDIRMPIMDGLEFVERALEKSTQVKFIILSGYSDFEYAKRAIRLGVSDYLLKPIDADELMKCVCRLRDKIEQEQQEQKRRESLMNTFRTELLDQTVEKLFRTSFPEKKEQIRSLEDAFRVVCDHIRESMDPSRRNIVLSHAYIVSAEL